jgi:type IV secretion system protein TrbL
VQGDVRWLAGVLIAIDITLAGLFWAMAPDEDVIARLIRKTLTIGVFAFILGNYNNLAQIIYNSFAGLGIEAGGGTMSAAQLLQPGKIAEVGINAGKPILTAISGMMGFTSVFANLVQILILIVAWLIVVLGFFVMAIRLFVSLIEFKLTTLAGFVLFPSDCSAAPPSSPRRCSATSCRRASRSWCWPLSSASARPSSASSRLASTIRRPSPMR